MGSRISLKILSCALLFLETVFADCRSSGSDFVDGGSYCIDTSLTEFFSFGTTFTGCVPSDTQGAVSPILVDPNSDEYFCSDIQTSPDGVVQLSTCNVPGYELRKSQMTSGTWIVVIQGLTFAWMRSFQISAGPLATVTSTPTAVFTVTQTPSTTVTSTSTVVDDTTLVPSTIVVPATTLTKTSTIRPSRVTVTSTSIITRTRASYTFSKSIVTNTVTASCKTAVAHKDPVCTIKPTLAKQKVTTASSTKSATATSTSGPARRDKAWAAQMRREAVVADLLHRRAPDLCSTTVIDPSNVVSSFITETAATSTETSSILTTVTATVTPPPVTSFSGTASTTVTITLSTPTRTILRYGVTTISTLKTIVATITVTKKVLPTGVVCVG